MPEEVKTVKVLYFKNNTCKVCEAMLPRVQEIAERYEIPFQVVNVEDDPETAGQFLIFSVPAVVLVESEGKELTRFARNFSLRDIEAYIDRYTYYMSM